MFALGLAAGIVAGVKLMGDQVEINIKKIKTKKGSSDIDIPITVESRRDRRKAAKNKKNGTKYIVIDPKYSETVGRLADQWLQLRPGTDAALAMGFLNVIINQNLYDQEFLENWTNAPHLIREDTGCVLVDAGNPGKADRILEQLAKRGVAPDAIHLILLTHGHVDHFGSAAALREWTGAPVAIHALDADAVRQGIHQPDSLQSTWRLIALLMRISALRALALSDRAPTFEPDIVFEGEFRLDEYSVAGRVIPTPGHTPGSVSVLLHSSEDIVGNMVVGDA